MPAVHKRLFQQIDTSSCNTAFFQKKFTKKAPHPVQVVNFGGFPRLSAAAFLSPAKVEAPVQPTYLAAS